jgi:hypothetical protein
VELDTGTMSPTGSLDWLEELITAPTVSDYTNIVMQTESSLAGNQPVYEYEWEIRLP